MKALIPIPLTFALLGLFSGLAFTQADLIYLSGTVITMEDDLIAEAIAIENDKILFVGSRTEALKHADSKTILKDLQGKTLMPAFVDPHNHFFTDARQDLDPNISMIERQQMLFAQGITTIGDPNTEDTTLTKIQAFANSGNMKMKTNLYLIRIHACNWEVGDWFKNHPVTNDKSALLRIAGVKIFADGGSCGTLPAVSWTYPAGGMGDLFLSQDQMNSWVEESHNLGYQIVIHAQGDRAVEQAQIALSRIITNRNNPLRHRIDHNAFMRPDLYGKYKEIGIIPVCFAHFPTCLLNNSSVLQDFYGAENLKQLEDWRTMFDANPDYPISWHSDGPTLEINTIKNLYSYVTRRDVDEEGKVCLPSQWLADHAITVEEVLPMMTIHAAYALNRDHQVGSLKAGKSADLVVLSDDPLTTPKTDLKNLQVLMTMASGEIVFCNNGSEQLCSEISTDISTFNQDFLIAEPYPNPTSSHLNIPISLSSPNYIDIQIISVTGEILYHSAQKYQDGFNHIKINSEEINKNGPGVLFLHLIVQDQFITKRIIFTN